MKDRLRINHFIKASQLRIIDDEGGNLGIMSFSEAMRMAGEKGTDLIEISPNANPPIAKLMDYGKYQYLENKKQKKNKAKSFTAETKTLQVKIATGEHDLELKAKQASKFLHEGHRVKIDLFLPGRAKYLDPNFLKTRLDRILHLVSEDYKVTDGPKKGPKGLSVVLERGTREQTPKAAAPVPPQTPPTP